MRAVISAQCSAGRRRHAEAVHAEVAGGATQRPEALKSLASVSVPHAHTRRSPARGKRSSHVAEGTGHAAAHVATAVAATRLCATVGFCCLEAVRLEQSRRHGGHHCRRRSHDSRVRDGNGDGRHRAALRSVGGTVSTVATCCYGGRSHNIMREAGPAPAAPDPCQPATSAQRPSAAACARPEPVHEFSHAHRTPEPCAAPRRTAHHRHRARKSRAEPGTVQTRAAPLRH